MAETSGGDVFARARRRLAALFTVIVIVLVAVSGVLVYVSFRRDLQSAALRDFARGETEQEFVARSLDAFRWRLLAVDGLIVAVVGVAGLLYARSTLRPIRDNVAAQKRFIADASHDLRTPLAVMKTDFEVALRDPALGEDVRPVLRSGLEEVDRMSGMVEDLLTMSRIDAHQEVLQTEHLDLAAIAVEASGKLSGLAAEVGVRLEARVPGHGVQEAGAAGGTAPAGALPQVPAAGDGRHVQRAVANLVRNAVEHSPAGGVVAVEAREAGGRSLVVVSDQGPGIPPEDLAHVFDRFYSADPSRSRERGGSGLGLAIARWAARRMGGDLTAESAPGRGTRMTLSLPAPRP